MALPACSSGQFPFLMSWHDSEGFLSEESGAPAASVCDLVNGSSYSGATGVCTFQDDLSGQVMSVPVQHVCWTAEYPDTSTPVGGVACTASSPCVMTMGTDMRQEMDAYVTIVLVVAFVFAFFHGFGIGDSRV